jgi:hypothetical protein
MRHNLSPPSKPPILGGWYLHSCHSKQSEGSITGRSFRMSELTSNVRDVTERLVARFIRRDARAQWSPGPAVTLRRLLVVLREAEVTPPASTPPDRRTPAQRFTDDFREYLRKERGLSETAIYGYTFPIDSFLARMFGTGKVSFARLTGCDVTDFLPWEIKRRRLHHTDNLLAGMRTCVPADPTRPQG